MRKIKYTNVEDKDNSILKFELDIVIIPQKLYLCINKDSLKRNKREFNIEEISEANTTAMLRPEDDTTVVLKKLHDSVIVMLKTDVVIQILMKRPMSITDIDNFLKTTKDDALLNLVSKLKKPMETFIALLNSNSPEEGAEIMSIIAENRRDEENNQ